MWDLVGQRQIPLDKHLRLSFNGQVMDDTKVFGDYGIVGLDWCNLPVTVDMTVVKGNPPWPNDDWDS